MMNNGMMQGMGAGMILGGVIGILIVVLLIVVIVKLLRNRTKRSRLFASSHLLEKLLKHFIAGSVTVVIPALTATGILRFDWQQRTAAYLRIASPEGIHP